MSQLNKQRAQTCLYARQFSKLIGWNFMSPSSLITFNGVCVWRITWYQPVTSNSCLYTVVSNGTPKGWPGGPCLPLENCWPPPVSHREAPPLQNHIQFIQSISHLQVKTLMQKPTDLTGKDNSNLHLRGGSNVPNGVQSAGKLELSLSYHKTLRFSLAPSDHAMEIFWGCHWW